MDYFYKKNGSTYVILRTVPGGNANRPSSVIQINRFFRECGWFASFDDAIVSLISSWLWPSLSAFLLAPPPPPLSSSWFDLSLELLSTSVSSGLLLFCFVLFNVVLCSFDCRIRWHDIIEITTMAIAAFSHKRNTSMVNKTKWLPHACAFEHPKRNLNTKNRNQVFEYYMVFTLDCV